MSNDIQPPRRTTRYQTAASGVAAIHISLITPPPRPRRLPPPRYERLPAPWFEDAGEEDNYARYVFSEFVEGDEEMVNLEDIPDLDLGACMFEDEDLQTHRTTTDKLGFTNITAVAAAATVSKKKKKRAGGAAVGGAKRRRAWKRTGGRERGPDGRFVGKSKGKGVERDPVVLERWEREERERNAGRSERDGIVLE